MAAGNFQSDGAHSFRDEAVVARIMGPPS